MTEQNKKHFARQILLGCTLGLCLTFVQCASDNQAINLREIGDESTAVGDEGTIFPSENGSTDTCDIDLETGDCVDTTVNDTPVRITQTNFDLGLSEINHIECLELAIPQALPFSAEFNSSKTSQITVDGQTLSAFAFDIGGSYSQDRIEGSETLRFCYLRQVVGNHSGEIRLIVNPGSTTGSQAYVLQLQGQTQNSLFTIFSPTPDQIIHKNKNDGVDNDEGDYLINASGTVNPSLFSILENGSASEIIIDAGGVKSKTTFDASTGAFSKSGVPISQQAGHYSITFSLKTKRGETISKSIPVTVAGVPQLEIEVRNTSGALINNSNPTDVPELVVGFKIPNLSMSGPSDSELPVTLSEMSFNGVSLNPNKTLYYNKDTSWCNKPLSPQKQQDETEIKQEVYPEFSKALTFCLPLDHVDVIENGINTIQARASNALGQTDLITYELILDYGKPIIYITQPTTNQLFDPSTTKITLAGFVKNYSPVNPLLKGQIPAVKNSDIGAWCQSKSETDSSCPVSGVKLWFNISPDDTNPQIYVYPATNADDIALFKDVQTPIFNNNETRGQCEKNTTTNTLVEANAGTTTTDANGTITTTVTTETETIIYKTDENGKITQVDANGTETIIFSPQSGSGRSKDITTENGTRTINYQDDNLDTQTTITTNTTTGEIVQNTTSTLCNEPYGVFKITLDADDLSHHARLNLFTNVFQMRAQSISGHRTIQTKAFHLGITKTQSFVRNEDSDQGQGKLKTAQLGDIKENCELNDHLCLNRAPIMISLSEGGFDRTTIQGQKLIKLTEDLLNDNLDFADFANGWTFWPKNENDQIDIEADFQKEWMNGEGDGQKYEDFTTLPVEWKQKFIREGLHSNIMAQKYWALVRYVQLISTTTRPNCAERPDLCFFQRYGDPTETFDVAQDSCGEVITTAFVPLGDLRHVAKHITNQSTSDITYLPEWTDVAGGDVNFNDFQSGRWVVHKIDLKPNGYIDADICLMPNDPNDTALNDQIAFFGCDADVTDAKVPAFWGHFISYNLVHGGLLGPMIEPFQLPKWIPGIGGDTVELQIDDPVMPLIWSVGKLRLSLTDALQIRTVQTETGWSNKIELNKSSIAIIEEDETQNLNDATIMATKSIQIDPFMNCAAYYEEQFPGQTLPYGCTNDPLTNNPFVLEMNSPKAQQIYQRLMFNGQSDYLLKVVWQGVIQTFRKIFSCIDDEMVNPLLNPTDFPYPDWINEEQRFETSVDLNDTIPNLGLETDLTHSDIKIRDGGLILRVPLSVSMDNVLLDDIFTSPFGLGLQSNLSTQFNQTKSHRAGHIVRSIDPLTPLIIDDRAVTPPLVSDNPHNTVFSGVSINIEELINAGANLLLKSGPLSLLETFDITELEPADDWTVGVDKVVLGRFDICDLAGKIPADLPKGQLFSTIQSSFQTEALHLNIKLNKNDPLTLAMNAIPGTGDNASELKLGFTNLIIEVKELFPGIGNSQEQQVYVNPIHQNPVITLRVDGTISAKAIYHAENRNLKIFIDDYEQQNVHITPIQTAGLYDDVNIVSDLITTVVKFAFERLSKAFVVTPTAEATVEVTFKNDVNGSTSMSVAKLLDADIDFNVTLDDNSSCDGKVPLYEGEENNENNQPEPTEEQLAARERLAAILNNMTIFKDRSTPINAEDLAIRPTPSDDVLDSDDPWHSYCGPTARYDYFWDSVVDPVQDMLCFVGLKDVIFEQPTLIFDNNNGYIHLSGDVGFELLERD